MTRETTTFREMVSLENALNERRRAIEAAQDKILGEEPLTEAEKFGVWQIITDVIHGHDANVDSSTAAGKAMLSMCGVFAEFERSIIVERINAGLARARAQGKELGRPRVDDKTETAIRKLLAKGTGKLKIARTLKVGVSTVQRVAAA
jgi:hypothetical protein